MIRIAYAEDDRGMREGMAFTLKSDPEFELVGTAVNGNEIIELVKKEMPDVVLMDINMPKKDGLQSTLEIKELFPEIKVIMLTVSDDKGTIIDALKVGANGYFLKTTTAFMVINNIKYVMQGGIILPPAVSDLITTQFPKIIDAAAKDYDIDYKSLLSAREMEVLKLVATGLNNQEIANNLSITEGTVKNHVSALIKKLNVRDRIGLALFAVKSGIKVY